MNEAIKEYITYAYYNCDQGTHAEHAVLVAYYYLNALEYLPKTTIKLLRARAEIEDDGYAQALGTVAYEIEHLS